MRTAVWEAVKRFEMGSRSKPGTEHRCRYSPMLQILFYIPDEIFGLPLFGVGILLFVWLTLLTGIGWFQAQREGGARVMASLLPYALFGSAAIVFLLPRLLEPIPGSDPTQMGLSVKGYGVFMFFAVTLAVSLAVHRAAHRGIPADYIYGLAVWLFVAGFAGARGFFVYQYRDQFRTDSWRSFLGEALNIAGGGLVVYGSLIGALIAYVLFTWRHKLPPLVFGDLMAPSMLLGLAIGRIGCLMNGCCYGGPCDYPWAIQFPQNSPPYMAQLQTGLSHGIHLKGTERGFIVTSVQPSSPAARAGLAVNDVIVSLNGRATDDANTSSDLFLSRIGSRLEVQLSSGKTIAWQSEYAPKKSLPTHPAQIYSSLNAFLLCGILLAFAPFQRRDGTLLALTLTIYPITRFLLEIVRQDEAAVNRFGFTISQTVSFGILSVGILLWMLVRRQPSGRAIAKTSHLNLSDSPQSS